MTRDEVDGLLHLELVQQMPEETRLPVIRRAEFDAIKQQLAAVVLGENYDPDEFAGPAEVVRDLVDELAAQVRLEGIDRGLSEVADHGFEE